MILKREMKLISCWHGGTGKVLCQSHHIFSNFAAGKCSPFTWIMSAYHHKTVSLWGSNRSEQREELQLIPPYKAWLIYKDDWVNTSSIHNMFCAIIQTETWQYHAKESTHLSRPWPNPPLYALSRPVYAHPESSESLLSTQYQTRTLWPPRVSATHSRTLRLPCV